MKKNELELTKKNVQILNNANLGIEKEWMDGSDVMLFLHISSRTLQNYRDRGILGFTQIGKKKIFYKRSDILDLLNNNYSKPFKN